MKAPRASRIYTNPSMHEHVPAAQHMAAVRGRTGIRGLSVSLCRERPAFLREPWGTIAWWTNELWAKLCASRLGPRSEARRCGPLKSACVGRSPCDRSRIVVREAVGGADSTSAT